MHIATICTHLNWSREVPKKVYKTHHPQSVPNKEKPLQFLLRHTVEPISGELVVVHGHKDYQTCDIIIHFNILLAMNPIHIQRALMITQVYNVIGHKL